jgi:hypothetical protein
MEVQVREKNGRTRSIPVELTGHENSTDLLSILGLDPNLYTAKAGQRTLGRNETVPPHEKITIEDKAVGEEQEIVWNEPTSSQQEKIALTIATHFARSPSRLVSITVNPEITPYQFADSLVKRVGGMNATDVTEMVDRRGRNLMEVRYRDRTFGELGVRSGETLDVQGDITQGS